MGCANCFSGCVQTTSDRCVKYTGIDVSSLEIESGHPLSSVLSHIIEKIIAVMNGTAIAPSIDSGEVCSLVTSEIPLNATLNQVLNAYGKVICDLDTLISTIQNDIHSINGVFDLGSCVSGVLPDDGSHAVLQAVIGTLCEAVSNIETLQTEALNYVTASDVALQISNYISSLSTKHYTKMIPYVAVEYYGPLSNFAADGTGIDDWEKIYLCNGENGTPDKRGRIPVGTTSMLGTHPYDSVVDPGLGNPNYATVGTLYGSNRHTLTEAEMPIHTHTPTVSVEEFPHTHSLVTTEGGEERTHYSPANVPDGLVGGLSHTGFNNAVVATKTDVSVQVSIANSGNSSPHNNVPPVLACHYIMYIP